MSLIKADLLQGVGAVHDREFDGRVIFKDLLYIGSPSNSGIATFGVKVVTSAALSGATHALTGAIEAGMLVWGVTARVMTTITNGTGSTTWSLGDDGTTNVPQPTKWGTTLALAAGTTTTSASWAAKATIGATEAANVTHPAFYAAATNIVLTASAGSFTGGVVKVSIHYMKFGAPAK